MRRLQRVDEAVSACGFQGEVDCESPYEDRGKYASADCNILEHVDLPSVLVGFLFSVGGERGASEGARPPSGYRTKLTARMTTMIAATTPPPIASFLFMLTSHPFSSVFSSQSVERKAHPRVPGPQWEVTTHPVFTQLTFLIPCSCTRFSARSRTF